MVHEDPSTEATQKLPKERMFRKKSILWLAKIAIECYNVRKSHGAGA
ncbi:MAG: hypothetical protein LBJ16_00395 [Holosporaceae bacterium]|nr:hypothetical protein [Holosporaceae bacterium]